MRKLFAGLLLAVPIVLMPTAALATPAPTPSPTASSTASPFTDVVLDETGFFTRDQDEEITSYFASVADRYGILPVVEVVQNLGGEDPERYAIKRATDLGIGDGEVDNGLYILVSLDERAVRVQPGIGLAREVSSGEIQSVVDNTIIPAFKNNDHARGIMDGVGEIGEFSLQGNVSEASTGPSEPINWTPTFVTIGVIGGGGAIAGATVIGVKRRKRLRAEAEAKRAEQLQEEIADFEDKLANSEELTSRFVTAEDRGARFTILDDHFRYSSFTSDDEKKRIYEELESHVVAENVHYSRIPAKYYRSTLQDEESIENYAGRLLNEKPKAKAAYDEALELERERAEAERKREKRRSEARASWKHLSSSQQEAFALASSSERRSMGSGLFGDYQDADKGSTYNSLGDTKKRELELEAKRAFERIPRYERERIARSSGRQREQYLQQYVSGYNPLLLPMYLTYSTAFMTTIQADEARAAQASSSSSSSSSSFGSFSSNDTFGGGSFSSGDGGGGSW